MGICLYTTQGELVCHNNMHKVEPFDSIESFDSTTQGLPDGSYVNTCKDCEITNNILKCHCKNKEGRYNKLKTSINKDMCDRFRNVDGLLLCENTPKK